MNISVSLDQYADICRDAIKKSSAKLNKSFENLLVEILLLYMIIPRKINFTQIERYGSHYEQTYRSNFNRKKSECINWLLFNLSLASQFEIFVHSSSVQSSPPRNIQHANPRLLQIAAN